MRRHTGGRTRRGNTPAVTLVALAAVLAMLVGLLSLAAPLFGAPAATGAAGILLGSVVMWFTWQHW